MATITVKPSGGDFSSLAAALADASTGAGDTIEISGDWSSTTDTAPATVSDDNITIIAPVGDPARHAGFDNGGSNYELNTIRNSLTIDANNCLVDGIILQTTTNDFNSAALHFNAKSNNICTVTNTIMRNEAQTGSASHAARVKSDASTLMPEFRSENNIYMRAPRAGIDIVGDTGSGTASSQVIVKMISDTVSQNNRAGVGWGMVSLTASTSCGVTFSQQSCNVAGQAGSGSCYRRFGTAANVTSTIHNTIASDNTFPPGTTFNTTSNATVTDGAPGSEPQVLYNDITNAPFDLRLQDDALNTAQDYHANASGAGLTIGDFTGSSIDIAGTTRPQNTDYDLGCFEVVSGAGPITAQVNFNSISTLALSANVTRTASLDFSSTSTLALAAAKIKFDNVDFNSAHTLTLSAEKFKGGVMETNSLSTLVLTPTVTRTSAASFGITAMMALQAFKIKVGAASFGPTSTLTLSGSVITGVKFGSVAYNSTHTISLSPEVTRTRTITLPNQHVLTLTGFIVGDEERNTGGWLSPEQVRRLKKLIKRKDDTQDRFQKKRRIREARVQELSEIFDRVTGNIPAEVEEKVAEIVEPFTEPEQRTKDILPPTDAIDFRALLRDVKASKELASTLVESQTTRRRLQEEEEAIMLLLMNA